MRLLQKAALFWACLLSASVVHAAHRRLDTAIDTYGSIFGSEGAKPKKAGIARGKKENDIHNFYFGDAGRSQRLPVLKQRSYKSRKKKNALRISNDDCGNGKHRNKLFQFVTLLRNKGKKCGEPKKEINRSSSSSSKRENRKRNKGMMMSGKGKGTKKGGMKGGKGKRGKGMKGGKRNGDSISSSSSFVSLAKSSKRSKRVGRSTKPPYQAPSPATVSPTPASQETPRPSPPLGTSDPAAVAMPTMFETIPPVFTVAPSTGIIAQPSVSPRPSGSSPGPSEGPTVVGTGGTTPPTSRPTVVDEPVVGITASPTSSSTTIQPTVTAATMTPTLGQATSSPTPPVDGNRAAATPFSVDYTISGSATDFTEASDVTLQYLESFFEAQFQLNMQVDMTGFVGTLTGSDLGAVQADYNVAVLFSESSSFVPGRADIDIFLLTAFNQPFVQELLDMLGELPASNPFSTTSQVVYSV